MFETFLLADFKTILQNLVYLEIMLVEGEPSFSSPCISTMIGKVGDSFLEVTFPFLLTPFRCLPKGGLSEARGKN